jgi:hypothetical protein
MRSPRPAILLFHIRAKRMDLCFELATQIMSLAQSPPRSRTKIGSLYCFFPNKESLADTIVVSARENLDVVFGAKEREGNSYWARRSQLSDRTVISAARRYGLRYGLAPATGDFQRLRVVPLL